MLVRAHLAVHELGVPEVVAGRLGAVAVAARGLGVVVPVLARRWRSDRGDRERDRSDGEHLQRDAADTRGGSGGEQEAGADEGQALEDRGRAVDERDALGDALVGAVGEADRPAHEPRAERDGAHPGGDAVRRPARPGHDQDRHQELDDPDDEEPDAVGSGGRQVGGCHRDVDEPGAREQRPQRGVGRPCLAWLPDPARGSVFPGSGRGERGGSDHRSNLFVSIRPVRPDGYRRFRLPASTGSTVPVT